MSIKSTTHAWKQGLLYDTNPNVLGGNPSFHTLNGSWVGDFDWWSLQPIEKPPAKQQATLTKQNQIPKWPQKRYGLLQLKIWKGLYKLANVSRIVH